MIKTSQKISLIGISVLLTLILFEFIVRIIFPSFLAHCIAEDLFFRPSTQFRFYADPEILHGVTKDSRFTVTSQGLRGDLLSDSPHLKIITFGGSAAECLYLDDTCTWQAEIKRKFLPAKTLIANAGRSGFSSKATILQLENLDSEIKADLGIVLCGVNDLLTSLQNKDEQDILAPENYGFYKHYVIWRIVERISEIFRHKFTSLSGQQDSTGLVYNNWREHYRSASIKIDSLPDLTIPLQQYEKNIIYIAEMFKKQEIIPVFISQPAIWRTELDDSLRQLLWMGGIGDFQNSKGAKYYSPSALEKGLELFNSRLKAVCTKHNFFFIDLAGVTPKSSEIFYDDCHFNNNGARFVGRFIADELRRLIPQLQTHPL